MIKHILHQSGKKQFIQIIFILTKNHQKFENKQKINPSANKHIGTKGEKMKKRNLTLGIMLIMIMVMAMSTGLMAQISTPPSNYSSSNGLSGDPYFISSWQNLYWLSQNSDEWNKYYEQKENISFPQSGDDDIHNWDGNKGFSPIGNITTKFTGSYYGQDHTIDGLYISRTSTSNIGFFGYIDGASITQLGVTNVNINGYKEVGGLVGLSDQSSTVNDCFSSGSVSGGNDDTGGLVGCNINSAAITNCYSTCNVTSVSYVGGLVGFNYSTINTSYCSGSVRGHYYLGGLLGDNNTGTVSNCYSFSNVYRNSGSYDSNIGGFCGWCNATIEYCYSTGNVVYEDAGNPTSKGFVGTNSSGSYTINFFDIGASNQLTGTGATGKTNNEMKGITTGNTISDWDWSTAIWERVGYNYPRLIDNPDPTLPVTLSTFTAQYLNNTPTLHWVTQSETDNIGWNVYRNEEEEFSSSQKITNEMIQGNGTTSEPSYYIYNDTSENIIIGQTYYYWLESIDLGGESHCYNQTVNIKIPDITEDPTYLEPPIVYDFKNVPNPVNEATEFQFKLDKESMVSVSIYNIRGELVRILPTVLVEEEYIKGIYWNGKDENGNAVKDGMYLYTLIVNGKLYQTRKLILLR